MSEFTKGSWVVSEASCVELEILSSDNIFICSTPNIDPDNTGFNVCNETAANMDLIAAAPDMFEALEYCLDSLGNEYALPNECIAEVRSAIAKAKGESV